jgi:hypothetical protein
MRMLSPPDRGRRGDWRHYVVLIIVVGEAHSYTHILRELGKRALILSHDEEARRIVLKTRMHNALEAAQYLCQAASSATAEIKYGDRLPRKPLSRKCLKTHGYVVSANKDRLLIFKAFHDASVLAEVNKDRLIAKYGRRTMGPVSSPGELPPSLFTFHLGELDEKLLRSARLRFMSLRNDILSCISRAG